MQASAKGLICCSVPIVHRTGCNKELSGPKRQVSCACVVFFFFFYFAGSSLLQGHSSSCGEQRLLSSYRAGLLTAVSISGGTQALGTWASGVADSGL